MKKKIASHTKLVEAAIDAAHAAGTVIRKHFGKKITVREKGKLGLVTNADIEAEEAALKILRKNSPDFALLTEETNAEGTGLVNAPGKWIVDPLDGTTNFVHRFPMFCVTIAAEIAGRTEVGVIYHPILDDLYVAVRGKGATLNGRKMRVSKTKKISDSLLTTGFAYRFRDLLHTEMNSFDRLSRIARAIRRPGSAALDLAYTASGVFDGFWERHLAPWDVAAGALLVQESGGKVTDFAGATFRPYAMEILASNGQLHSGLLKAIQESKTRPSV